MKKEKEVEVVDSREADVDLMEKLVDLTILSKIRENLNGRMLKKTRPSGKVVVHAEEVLDLIEEKVIPILEMVFLVIASDVLKRDIDLLNVDPLKMGKVIEMLYSRR